MQFIYPGPLVWIKLYAGKYEERTIIAFPPQWADMSIKPEKKSDKRISFNVLSRKLVLGIIQIKEIICMKEKGREGKNFLKHTQKRAAIACQATFDEDKNQMLARDVDSESFG